MCASDGAALYWRRPKTVTKLTQTPADDAVKQSIIESALQTYESVVSVEHDADMLGATVGQILVLVDQIPGLSGEEWDDIIRTASHLGYKRHSSISLQRDVSLRRSRGILDGERVSFRDLRCPRSRKGSQDCDIQGRLKIDSTYTLGLRERCRQVGVPRLAEFDD